MATARIMFVFEKDVQGLGTLGPSIPPFGISECQICKKKNGVVDLFSESPETKSFLSQSRWKQNWAGQAVPVDFPLAKGVQHRRGYMLIDVNVDMSPILYTLKV